ncbi:MAG: TonB-dependent receptor [Bacteroidetes bacterium]|nr:TonB-dependent receptor [Bacteroidota bacterium]
MRFASAALVAALLAAPAALAQSPAAAGGTISGRLLDAQTLEPLEAATASLWRAADSSLVTGGLADLDGKFEFSGLRPGRYYVRLSIIGYRSRSVNVELTASALTRNLGDVKLDPEDAQGSEVTVTGEREPVQVGIDRTTYNVADQAVTSGGTAADVLRTVPSVELDAEGNVSLRGSQNVAILINGRPTAIPRQFLAAYLQQLPASSIDKVEVIPNPSARYEPDGMAGMLNIVLKQNSDPGLSGAVQAGGDTRGGINTSVNVNYGKGRWTTNATYGFRRNVRGSDGTNLQQYLASTPNGFVETLSEDDRTGLGHNLSGSVEYALAPRQTLGLQLGVSTHNGDDNGTATYTERTGQTVTRAYTRTGDGSEDGFDTDAALTYRNTVRPSEHELVVEARFATHDDSEQGRYQQAITTGTAFSNGLTSFTESDDEETQRRDGSVQIDYVRPVGDFRIETGAKATLRQLDAAQTGVQVLPTARTLNEEYGYDETIYAGYLTVGRSFGAWNAQAGVRAEQANASLTSLSGADVDKDYFRVYPSAFLTYTIAPGQTLRASYSQRVNRPDPRQLNPVADLGSPTFRRVGNPDLDPEYTHAFELAYAGLLPVGLVQITPYFRRTENAIGFTSTTDAAGVTTLSFSNLDRRDSYGADITLGARVPNRFQAGLTGSVYRVVSDGTLVTGESIGVDAVTWSMRFNGSVTLRPGTELSGFLSYNPPQKTEQGRFLGRAFSSIALRQSLMDNRASLTLNAFDPLGLMKFGGEMTQGNVFTTFERQPTMRNVGLTFQYTFGQQQRRPQQRQQQQEGQTSDPLGGF